MLAVADINAIWRIKPFVALSKLRAVSGLSPRRWFTPDPDCLTMASADMSIIRIGLPPGWASLGASLLARPLLHRVRFAGAGGLFVTSPHYLPLARLAAREMPVYYYCSDDYSTYSGWGGDAIESAESELTSLCRRSFFVSRVLAQKAVQTLGADPSLVEISPNATDAEFVRSFPIADHLEIESILRNCPRPILGVVGAVNERLDFSLLLECANLPEVGTVLLVGPVSGNIDSSKWNSVSSHPKVITTGARPHREVPIWMRKIDVALIPYAESRLNHACSPMRLFDHLASGKPVVATSSCDQVSEYDGFLDRGTTRPEVVELVRKQCANPIELVRSPGFLRELTWECRAQFIASRL